MSRSTPSPARFAALLIPLSALAISANAQSEPTLRVSYKLVTTLATVNTPVFVELTIENGLSDELTFKLASNTHNYEGFQCTVLRPDGQIRTAPREHPETPSESYSVSVSPIRPFSTFTKLLLANKWFDFDKPGRYVIEMATTNIRTVDGSTTGYATNGHVTLDVAPRDPAALERICADLEQRVMNASNIAAETEPAEALAYINDPVAVPYLARLLRAKESYLAHMITDALWHIGDRSAVDALIAALSGPTTEAGTPPLIRMSLMRIARTTNDPAIKSRIDAWLR